MNIISTIFSEPAINDLGWTIVHSLWQATLIALCLSLLMILLRRFTAQTRYIISVSALAAILSITLLTFYQNYTLINNRFVHAIDSGRKKNKHTHCMLPDSVISASVSCIVHNATALII